MRVFTVLALCLAASCSDSTPAPDAASADRGRSDAPPGLDARPPDLGGGRDGKAADAKPPAADKAAPNGCATPIAAGDHLVTLGFGGKTREYDLHVPKGLKAGVAVPLVLDFHGLGSDKFQQRLISGFLGEADAHGFVVAHPNGYEHSWNAGPFCCGKASAEKLDDLGLAKAIVQQIAGKVCIDPKRVYATGISNGGMFSHRLACEVSSVFAAVAPVAGRIDLFPITSCAPGRPVSVIAFHGDHDEVVPYSEAQIANAHWLKVNGCTDAGSVTFSKGKASCTTWSACKAATQVSFCTLDAGHITYWNVDNVAISTLGWQFLSKFKLP
jgi:polyhydroxybutyrate depolymerase